MSLAYRTLYKTVALSLMRTYFAAATICGSQAASHAAVVPQCAGVRLSASYLAQVSAGEGPGFLLLLTNDTNRSIKLAKPFPTSAHWYAQAPNGRWLWRASSGSGGSLANALSERGPLFASMAQATPPGYLIVGAHQHLEVAESMQSSPVLHFRPGCQRCRNPGDERFRAVLAYAYLPSVEQRAQGLLACGLRSETVVMPPLE